MPQSIRSRSQPLDIPINRHWSLPPSLPNRFFTAAKPSSTATSISSAFSSLYRSRLCRTYSYRRSALFSSPAAAATRCCSRPSSPLPSSSIAAGPLPLKHQQRRRYLTAPHLLVLLGTPLPPPLPLLP
ncbi:hypothetical protein BHE74_00054258 [Ensete ventricosum]|nr:hypothetical protein BHE74_00054258 [Ensete ventricosum]RZS23567.1 hypothetical protein BHM03_00056521 [Ensete ventricosum]